MYYANLTLFPIIIVSFLTSGLWVERTYAQDFTVLEDVDHRHLVEIDELRSQLVWFNDPFFKTPGISPHEEEEVELVLNAVILGDIHSQALLNGKMYHEGSLVHGHTIEEIGSNFVILRKGHYLRELTIPYREQTDPLLEIYRSSEDRK